MAIIRSKIARQLLADGGVSLDDAKMMAPQGEFLAYINPKEAGVLKSMGGSGRMTPMGIPSFTEDDEDQIAMDAPDYATQDLEEQQAIDAGEPTAQMSTTSRDLQGYGPGTNINDLDSPSFFDNLGKLSNYTPIGILNKFDQKFLKPGRDKYNLNRRTEFLRREGVIGPGEEDEKYTDEYLLSPEGLDMLKGMGYTTIQDVINNRGEGGDNEPIKRLKAPITEKKEEESKGEFDDILKYYGAKFEDGGEVRQEYGLGDIVKKATRAVKKVAKSPIGKAALFAGLGTYGLGVGPFGASGAFANAKGAGFLRNFLLKDAAKKFALDNINPFGAITAASLLAGGLSKQDEEEEETIQTARSDPEFQKYLSFYGGPRRFAAEGGMMNPNDEMLNLSGNEMDLRGGGFVPLGEYEKKDDVPARLSKNEFVMTADAVRAAGGGSVDRGADIMYKTMKTLENKVA